MQFRETYPAVSSYTMLYMLETFGASVKLVSDHSPQELKVQLWTNALNKFNSQGNWHPINLSYQDRESLVIQTISRTNLE